MKCTIYAIYILYTYIYILTDAIRLRQTPNKVMQKSPAIRICTLHWKNIATCV